MDGAFSCTYRDKHLYTRTKLVKYASAFVYAMYIWCIIGITSCKLSNRQVCNRVVMILFHWQCHRVVVTFKVRATVARPGVLPVVIILQREVGSEAAGELRLFRRQTSRRVCLRMFHDDDCRSSQVRQTRSEGTNHQPALSLHSVFHWDDTKMNKTHFNKIAFGRINRQ